MFIEVMVKDQQKHTSGKMYISINGIFGLQQHPQNLVGHCILMLGPQGGIEVSQSYNEVKQKIDNALKVVYPKVNTELLSV